MSTFHTIGERWKHVEHTVREAALSCGRNPEEITIIAVSKMHPLQSVQQAFQAGARVFGENYAQEFRDKIQEAERTNIHPEWHFIGSLQSNKVKYIIPHASLIHSCSTISVADEIERLSQKHDVISDILIQVNTSGESSKSGIEPAEIDEFISLISRHKHISLRGLMTIPTATDNISQLSSEFSLLRNTLERLKDSIPSPETWNMLSMGMSDDFSIAIQEGATHVRIGTAIFGARQY